MKVTRVYNNERGQSCFGELEVELRDGGTIGRLSRAVPAESVIFRENDPGYDFDWHVAPARQLVVLLDGAIEIEVFDGTRRIFRGGDVILVEDTTGKGHRSRHVEKARRRSLFVVLAQGAELPLKMEAL